MSNIKQLDPELYAAAVRLFGKKGQNIPEGADPYENDREIIFFNTFVAGNGHLFIRVPMRDYDWGVNVGSTVDPKALERVLKAPVDDPGRDLPPQCMNIMRAGLGRHFAIAADGDHVGAFVTDYDTGLVAQDGGEFEGYGREWCRMFVQDDVSKVFRRFNVKGVRVCPFVDGCKFSLLKFDVVFKGREFEVNLLNMGTMDWEDEVEHALGEVYRWAHADRVRQVA